MDIAILNTGCANLTSIKIAVQRLGYDSVITSEPEILIKAKKIFLPGIGTASEVMKMLSKKNIIRIIQEFKKPILGICLGMQIFYKSSEEYFGSKTIGIINSSVFRLKNNNLPLPHMGWNQINFHTLNPLFKNIPNQSRFYFIHSYAAPVNQYTLSTTDYGISFSSAIQKDNFFGVQFHPEKSGVLGSQLLKNFLEI